MVFFHEVPDGHAAVREVVLDGDYGVEVIVVGQLLELSEFVGQRQHRGVYKIIG